MQALPIIGIGLQVASTVIGVMGAAQEANYQAEVARVNAQIAQDNAGRARMEAKVAAQEGDFSAAADIGAMVASLGASGLQLGSGSSLLRQKSAGELASKDRGYTVYRGETEATNFTNQAQGFENEASGALAAGKINMMSSLIGGASKTVNLLGALK